MIKRKIREGELSAYYYKDHPGYYIMYFHDYTSSSYNSNKNTYLNPQQYTTPECIICIISELFKVQNEKSDLDVDCKYVNSLNVMMVRIDRIKPIKKLVSIITGFNVVFKHIYENYYSVSIKTCMSIYYLLNFTLVFFMTISSLNSSSTYTISDGSAKKLIDCINKIKAPYYYRYMMSSRVLHYKDFKMYQNDLEGYPDYKIKLNYGNTANIEETLLNHILLLRMILLI